LSALSIGELSFRTAVNIETIRYYERIGIMPDPGRTLGGNRQYDREHLKRLAFVKRCRTLGFGIEDIRTMLQLVDRKGVTCAQVHQMTIDHLAIIREKLSSLQRLERVLNGMAAKCSGDDVPECPILDALFEHPKIED